MASSAMTPLLQEPKAMRTVTVVSGNLFQIAAQELGDVAQWTRIALLNGMTDPFFTGLIVLRIPSVDKTGTYDGILYA